ncbi:MAG: SGNH/GDSL hydrolase family protein [Atopobiaceae bacterium]|nr:SGNH/GDSL hydrolase family protein [Atopobiaceae bacterium]
MLVSVFGDSISTFEGYNPPGYAVYYDASDILSLDVRKSADCWWMQTIMALGGELLVNDSYSGSTVSSGIFPAATNEQRLSNLGKDGQSPDLILIYLGVNDFMFCVPIGRQTSDGPRVAHYFADAYLMMLEELESRYPQAAICCATIMRSNWPGRFRHIQAMPEHNETGLELAHYDEAIRAAVARTNAKLVDLASFGKRYDAPDGAHPNARGHAQLARQWIHGLRGLGLKYEGRSLFSSLH